MAGWLSQKAKRDLTRGVMRFEAADGFDRDLAGLLSGIASPEARSNLIAKTARELEAKADAANRAALGHLPPKKTTVDRREGAPFESVNPDSGVILIEYEIVSDVVRWCHEEVVRNSPVGTKPDGRPGHPGLFQASHIVLADGAVVSPTGQLPPAERYQIVNTQPYSRKIEQGQSKQAPIGVYEVVAVLAQQRFGNAAHVWFDYVPLDTGAISQWSRTASARAWARNKRGGNPALHSDWLQRQPAIIVEAR